MLTSEWMHLKSGTDIRGTAVLTDGGQPAELTDEVVRRITAAFICRLSEKLNRPASELTVSVGRDSRISGPRIRDAVISSLTGAGVRVLDCSLASTPAMFMTTVDAGCDAAIQITASHHPFDRNGLKFFLPEGGLNGAQITRILETAQAGIMPPAGKGSVEKTDYMSKYAEGLRKLICESTGSDMPLEGFHIVVDAGNGVGGFYATQVLKKLGAEISGSRYLEPDGYFPNHIPNPENETAMASICEAVLTSGADLGVIFDTDVDRAGCVDSEGHEINRNRLVALAAALVLEEHPGGTIVTDSVTSAGLAEFIEQLGGKHHRFKRGYRNVIDEAIRLNQAGVNAPLAIETSGHAALRDNYFLDDGAYLMTRIIIKASRLRKEGKTLDSLISSLREPAESVELRFPIKEADFRTYGEAVLEKLKAELSGWENCRLAAENYEGVRADVNCGGEGWLLLRMSVHDPVMPLNIESDVPGGCRRTAEKLAPFMRSQASLDTAEMDTFLDVRF